MAHSFPQSASISFSAGSISYLQITAITEAGRMVAFSSASPFPALFSFSPVAFHSFLFSSCSPPPPLLPLFAFVLCVLRKSSLLSFLLPFLDAFHISFLSPYDHLLLPLFPPPHAPFTHLLPRVLYKDTWALPLPQVMLCWQRNLSACQVPPAPGTYFFSQCPLHADSN